MKQFWCTSKTVWWMFRVFSCGAAGNRTLFFLLFGYVLFAFVSISGVVHLPFTVFVRRAEEKKRTQKAAVAKQKTADGGEETPPPPQKKNKTKNDRLCFRVGFLRLPRRGQFVVAPAIGERVSSFGATRQNAFLFERIRRTAAARSRTSIPLLIESGRTDRWSSREKSHDCRFKKKRKKKKQDPASFWWSHESSSRSRSRFKKMPQLMELSRSGFTQNHLKTLMIFGRVETTKMMLPPNGNEE